MLTPKLNESEGYFQIGPSESCWEMFVLSVTVVFAGHLEQVCYKLYLLCFAVELISDLQRRERQPQYKLFMSFIYFTLHCI